jgi:hypothetical protein
MKMSDIIPIAMPILAAAVGWLIGQIILIDNRVTKIESVMPVLVAPDGTPADSPDSERQRAAIKEQLMTEINDLKIRLSVMEQEKK